MRKRKHHKKPKVVRDPEQIKQLRLERVNVKRQGHWNNRFVLETIPDLFAPKRTYLVSIAKRRDNISRGRYPLHSAYVEKERPKLPELNKQRLHDTVSRQNHKSFKIRHLKKDTEVINKPKEEITEKEIDEIIEKDAKKQNKKISKRQRNREKLILKLEEKTKIFPICKYYKDLLSDLIQRASDKKHKPIRTIIQKEIDSIGANDNIYFHLEKLASDRKSILKTIKETGAATILKSYLDLQMHSLLLVEEILKFKAFWQAIYQDNLHHEKKVHFYYEDSNYLVNMNSEVAGIAEKDPFLVEKTTSLQRLINSQSKEQELQERKEMMLKIRACELLLIEEELLANI